MFLLWHASSSSDLPALATVFKAGPFNASLLKSAECFSWSLLSWMWCLIQATCFLVPENNDDKLHLLYGKAGKAMGLHSGMAGHVPAETLVKARNCSVHSLPFEQSYRGRNHPCLLSWAFLWSQSQGCQEQLQECKHVNSEGKLESELRVNFTPLFQPAPMFPFWMPHEAVPQNIIDGIRVECHTVMEHRW